MSLSSNLQDIFGRYEFSDEERWQLIDLLEEDTRQYKKELASGEADWAKSKDLLEALTDNAEDFFNELCEYTIVKKCSPQDIVDVDNEIIKELKGE